MDTKELTTSLTILFSELSEGAPKKGSFMLNHGDPGLLKSLEKLSAAAASATAQGGASIAAHADHLRYGLSLLNRWAGGENPWSTADWTQSWKKTRVSDAEWKKLRADLSTEARNWLAALGKPRNIDGVELTGMISSIGHFAYHLGAIRQINRDARGPGAGE